ncbi:hypothetical protein [Paenibacillus sp. FSL P4-0502]|uniref:hypothetical protein n=1 Tax=Paenibacillus sp. FSL P4-0502 TaxID=2975319 RepID=UPI0030FA92FE
MKISQTELLSVLHNMTAIKNDDFARLFLLKKSENLLRDFLTIELEKLCRKKGGDFTTAVHEFSKKRHDVAILTGGINRRRSITYSPTTIIELKFTKAAWITKNNNAPVGEKFVVQDNIWRENMKRREDILGKESGVKKDLVKMIQSQSQSENKLAIHQIVALVNPHQQVDNKYRHIVDGINLFNNQLSKYGNDHGALFQSALESFRAQLDVIQTVFLDERKLEIGYETITIGEALGTLVDLHYVVISEKNI